MPETQHPWQEDCLEGVGGGGRQQPKHTLLFSFQLVYEHKKENCVPDSPLDTSLSKGELALQ